MSAPVIPRDSGRPGGVFLDRILRTFHTANQHAASAEHVIARCHALLSERGEASGRIGAMEAITAYRVLNEAQRIDFFRRLLTEFSPDRAAVDRAIEGYRRAPSHTTVLALQSATEAPRQELFRRFNMAPGGTQMLLDMRRDLLQSVDTDADLRVIDADLGHLFRSWFNRGFLTLQRIDWRTSAVVLERLIQYEAVHQITSWRDLRRRLEADRRCYAFFHPALPEEPLIFIEIALTRGMSAQIHHLIDPDSSIVDPGRADTAMFYSITSCQEGLRGISFGNFLIKQVVEDLGVEFGRLKTFATLSPIPQFRTWLESADDAPGRPAVSVALAAFLKDIDALAAESGDGINVPRDLERELCMHCAWYLIRARRDGLPRDPVARFHLANGARLERLNPRSDLSATGMRRSFGLAVNYLYRWSDLERNHERYARDASVIASREVSRLLALANR